MAAEPMTTKAPPYIEFYAETNGVRVRVYDTIGNIEYEVDINAATWAALDTAMDTPTTTYIPMNHNGPLDSSGNNTGAATRGGKISPVAWAGAA